MIENATQLADALASALPAEAKVDCIVRDGNEAYFAVTVGGVEYVVDVSPAEEEA